jgi:syntaxin 16
MDRIKRLIVGEADPRQLKSVEEDEFDQQQQASEFTDDLQELARERDEGINALVNNLNELAMIFKDLSALVLEQGSVLDRIDFNIQQTSEFTARAYAELRIADKRQRSSQSAYCIMLLVVFISVLAMIVIFKFTA